MHNTGQSHPVAGGGTSSGKPDADINAPEAWDIITDANDIIVAVIDTGVCYTHSDIADNMWINMSEDPNDANHDGYPGEHGKDDDGDGLTDEDSGGYEPGEPNWTNDLFEDDDENGYANDIYGYDFSGYNPEDQDSDPMDESGHGTHVAGIIGAVGNNEIGITGVCWKTRIMALKIMPPYEYTYPSQLQAFVSNAREAIDYANNNGAKVINASWGIGDNYSLSLKAAIERSKDMGVLFVTSAGNYKPWPPGDDPDIDYLPKYPASYDLDNIISVMATNHDDDMWYYSKYGNESVDLAAPGQDILSCIPGGEYDCYNGTSMAAPHVAGACALLWAQHSDWNWQMVKATILNSVDKLPSLKDKCVTEGRLNLYKALTSKPPLLTISKTDDYVYDPNFPTCGVEPNDLITYTIEYANPQTDPNAYGYLGTTYNVEITDYLPPGTWLNTADPNEDFFDGETCIWYIEELKPGDSGTITLSVWVNEGAEPSGELENTVTIESENAYNDADEKTPVCCWDEDEGILYVDQDAIGTAAGTSWFNAYTDLTSALNRATKECGREIWIAEGTYSPGDEAEDTFNMVEGVAIYGGFAGDETDRDQRDWIRHPTILTGNGVCDAVVTADDANAVLDGCIIEDAVVCGVQCKNDAILHVEHCTVRYNAGGGIHADGGDPNVSDCTIHANFGSGVYCSESAATIAHCLIEGNNQDGVRASFNPIYSLLQTASRFPVKMTKRGMPAKIRQEKYAVTSALIMTCKYSCLLKIGCGIMKFG